jgi:hypothetical protein
MGLDSVQGNLMSRFVNGLFLGLGCVLFLGCSDGGPRSYRLSGTVKLAGVPIPFGEVIITPDAVAKNSGPQGKATIQNGQFDTSSAGGMGVSGGAVVIRVNGMSGPNGQTICEYEFKVDLPGKAHVIEIVVPEKDAHNANPKKPGQKTPEI